MIEAVPRPETPELSDRELARRVAEGDHAAFEVLMRRHNRALFRTARAILRDDAEAEDAVQEAYLKAYRTIGSFRGEARLSTWLARIAANEALMRQRKAARRSEIVPLAMATVWFCFLAAFLLDAAPIPAAAAAALGFCLMGVGGWLGGRLVYEFGIGVRPVRDGASAPRAPGKIVRSGDARYGRQGDR